MVTHKEPGVTITVVMIDDVSQQESDLLKQGHSLMHRVSVKNLRTYDLQVRCEASLKGGARFAKFVAQPFARPETTCHEHAWDSHDDLDEPTTVQREPTIVFRDVALEYIGAGVQEVVTTLNITIKVLQRSIPVPKFPLNITVTS